MDNLKKYDKFVNESTNVPQLVSSDDTSIPAVRQEKEIVTREQEAMRSRLEADVKRMYPNLSIRHTPDGQSGVAINDNVIYASDHYEAFNAFLFGLVMAKMQGGERGNNRNLLEYESFSEEPINEAYVEYGGVRLTPANDKTGRVILSYGPNKVYYKIKAKVKKIGITFYDGPIAVVAAWKNKEGESWVKDNTGKLFMLDEPTLKTLAAKAKVKAPTIALNGTGEVGGVEGSYAATLTRTA